MVIEVKAWSASDGSIHETEEKALEKDAMILLGKLSVFNVASAMAVVKAAEEVVSVLMPLAEHRAWLKESQAVAEEVAAGEREADLIEHHAEEIVGPPLSETTHA